MRIAPETNLSLNGVVNALFSKQACDKIDKEKLIVGILVELEHTSDKEKAKKIATDHLLENPDYYTDPMKEGWGTEEALGRIEELSKAASSENSLSLSATRAIRLQPGLIPGEILVFKSDSKDPSFRMIGVEMQDIDLKKVREFIYGGNLKDDNVPLVNGKALFQKTANATIKTWAKIRDEEDPEGKNHDLSLHCVECGESDTCKCSKPKRKFEGVCDKCCEKHTASVFVLEDDQSRIDIFKRAFGSNNVITASSVKEAVGLLRSKKFAKVFLDRDLSSNTENGEDVAWQMKQEKLCQETPVVIHSENTRGQKVMAKYLGSYHSNVTVTPFRELKKQLDIPGGVSIPKTAQEVADNQQEQPRKWQIKVTFDDGDTIDTFINGTQEEIRSYYLNHDFTRSDEKSTHRPIEVLFIEDLGDVPESYHPGNRWFPQV
jgi:hypothetical protein